MLNRLKNKNQGFTIIEVMIVLAIAGLIILIVLLAVPALQRNSRNTAIKNDAGAVAAAVGEFESNNDGASPTSITGTGTVTVSGATGTTPTSGKVQGATAMNAAVTTVPTSVTTGTITPMFGKKCDGTTSTRTVALFYSVESSGTSTVKCVES